ncbi:MAG: NAD(P)H-hydrate dehydratase [Rhizobiaceae bacterium]
MRDELLTPREMTEADRLTIASGSLEGMDLMRRAGAAVAAAALARFPQAAHVAVLCGPGNNGGDGYVAAGLLAANGAGVSLWRTGEPTAGTDAGIDASECPLSAQPVAAYRPAPDHLVIDALFGAGLSKPVGGEAAAAIERVKASGARVVAVDLPSGVSGASGQALGTAIRADLTVTFFRKKPGHLLYPGRSLCGETVVADIGIRAGVLDGIAPKTFENAPARWRAAFPTPSVETHKYARGHVGVFSGGPASTGAARLSAAGAARAGAGAVTMLSPDNALLANATHLTSTILRRAGSWAEVDAFLDERRPAALVFGPGLGARDTIIDSAHRLIEEARGRVGHIVFDADAFTIFARDPSRFFAAARTPGAPGLVLTPHQGEFARLFPDIAGEAALSKPDRARAAAARANVVVIYKGPDTVIAAPDGRAAINANGTPWLATAGSGDVLAGLCAGLLSQRMPAFEAGCAAVWLHAEAATRFGPGLIADDIPGMVPAVLREILRWDGG